MSVRIDYNEFLESRRRLAAAFQDKGIVRQSKHRLRGGDEATSYFDFDIATNDTVRCADIVNSIVGKLLEIQMRRKIDFLAFVEKMGRATVGAIRLSGAISINVGIPSFIIRLGKELDFEKIKLYGNKGTPAAKKLTGLRIVLITDHITTGAEILQTIKVVENAGGVLSDVICYTLKPNSADSTIKLLLEKNIIIHAMNYFYDFPDGTYGTLQGGTIESADQLLKFRS